MSFHKQKPQKGKSDILFLNSQPRGILQPYSLSIKVHPFDRDFTFQKLEFCGCQPQGSRNLVWLLHVCSGQQANYKNILNRHDDMMTLSWFEWSNNTSHEKQEISILMIKKAWTRLKSSS
jgi:hypothetical protein